MTDTFIVDRAGEFVVGKAQSTPEDESVGFMASARDALAYWDSDPALALPRMVSGIYSGTAMLNRLLERKGRRVGVIVTGGTEDTLRLERGIQTYLGYPYSDRLHVATHHHNEPLVPRDLVKGVRERVDGFGEPAIPISGPIGGVIGAKYLVDKMRENASGSGPSQPPLPADEARAERAAAAARPAGTSGHPARNVVCTDIGGTSFDIALITDGEFQIRQIPDIGRFLLNLPLVQVDSIGAGTGSFVRIDPNSHRPELGPDSAGAKIGVCWPDGGLDTPSVTDLNLVLGRLNPDYFLGGDVPLDVERARAAVGEPVAAPLGLSAEQAAAGVIELFDETLAYQAVAQVLGKGYSPVDYTLLCYGGGGPLHVAGYTAGVSYREVLVPAWAAGFSAFGCACGDYAYRYDLTVDMPIQPTADLDEKAGVGIMVDGGWQMLRERVVEEFAKSGVGEEEIEFSNYVRMQYYGQLNDIEILSPHQALETGEQVDDLIAAFEEAYAKLYARSARSPELGYLVTNVIVTGSVAVEKPALPDEEEVAGGAPEPKATRPVWWRDEFTETRIYEQDQVRAGHIVEGPAVIESPADTFAIPPGRRARLGGNRVFHLESSDG